MDSSEKEKLQAKIHRYAVKGVFRNKRILLYGGSRHLCGMLECLTAEGCTVAGILDKNSRKSGSDYMGIPIRLPEELLEPYDSSLVVLILSSRFYQEMVTFLTNSGYKKNRHFFVLNDVIGIKNDESFASFLRIWKKNYNGLAAYRKLTRGSDRHVFVVPLSGSGNVYLTGLFFREYLERHNIQKYVFVVVSQMCRRVAELFGIQNIVVMNAEVAEDMIRCGNFLRGSMALTVLHDGWRSDVTRWLKGWKGLNFENYFRYFSYDFDDTVRHQLPPRSECSAEVALLFEKYKLQEGRTVVLAPYANTLHGYRKELWKEIAEYFQAKGFSVCTNCASEAEKPIEGTTALFFPFSMAVEFLEKAGYFISWRSGLCDIVSAAKCKKLILYEDGTTAFQSSAYDYFGLREMGLCEDALEIEVGADTEGQALQDAFAFLT